MGKERHEEKIGRGGEKKGEEGGKEQKGKER